TGICGGFKFISQVDSVLAYNRSVSNGSASPANGYGILVGNPLCCDSGNNANCCALDPAVCSSLQGCLPFVNCCPTFHKVINNNEVVDNTLWGIFDRLNPSGTNAYFANIARGNGPPTQNYSLPAGTPIRIWPLPAPPNPVDNFAILDAQLDNMDIRP